MEHGHYWQIHQFGQTSVLIEEVSKLRFVASVACRDEIVGEAEAAAEVIELARRVVEDSAIDRVACY